VADERYDQQRPYLGLEIPASKTVLFNVGYLNIYRPRENIDRMNNVLFISMSINLQRIMPGPVRSI